MSVMSTQTDKTRSDSSHAPLSERLQRNQREILIALVLTLAAGALLIEHYGR